MVRIQLVHLAHTRSGDKGDTANVGVIAYDPEHYELLRSQLTPERVKAHFASMVHGGVERFELPNLGALNFLLHGALGGGGTMSLMNDAQGKVWQPGNFDGREHGEVSMLDALVRSLNLATVDLGMKLGVENVAKYLERLAGSEEVPAYPSIFLGAVEMSPFRLAEMYTIIANDGFRIPLRAISAVTNRSQRKLNRYGLELKPLMPPAVAAIMRYALSRVIAEGTGRNLLRELDGVQPLAGKTGTSDDYRDSWFAGFGANRLGVTWVGRDDNKPTGLTGSGGALRIWAAAMMEAGLRPLELDLPSDVKWQRVNLAAGTIIDTKCSGGELIPVHEASVIPHAPNCTDAVPETKIRRGLFDRIRDIFR
ncbi:MAG: penicillin-binding transpeptidase domain-containing protein [Gammaproteobacteria bacterium]